jgi:hypothetical protein
MAQIIPSALPRYVSSLFLPSFVSCLGADMALTASRSSRTLERSLPLSRSI